MQDMLRKSVNVALQVALCAGPTKSVIGQTGGDPVLADVRYLAADSLSGRGIGTPGLDAAAAYIARRFEAAGLRPVFDHNALDILSLVTLLAHLGKVCSGVDGEAEDYLALGRWDQQDAASIPRHQLWLTPEYTSSTLRTS